MSKFWRSTVYYLDFECLVEKIDGCINNPERSSTIKVDEHASSGFSMSTILSFKSIENNHDVYGTKDCMKKLCQPFKRARNENN